MCPWNANSSTAIFDKNAQECLFQHRKSAVDTIKVTETLRSWTGAPAKPWAGGQDGKNQGNPIVNENIRLLTLSHPDLFSVDC